MKLEKSLDLKTEIKDGKIIKYEFGFGDGKYFASSDSDFFKKFELELLKYPHIKIILPKLDEKIYGKKFINGLLMRSCLHNHPVFEND